MPIFMPPLRERTDDLENLIKSILKKEAHLHKITGIQPDTLEILKSYRWPGNVGELKSIIERAILMKTLMLLPLRAFLRVSEQKLYTMCKLVYQRTII